MTFLPPNQQRQSTAGLKHYKQLTDILDADESCFIDEGDAVGGFLVDIRLSKLMSNPALRHVAGTLCISTHISLTNSILLLLTRRTQRTRYLVHALYNSGATYPIVFTNRKSIICTTVCIKFT